MSMVNERQEPVYAPKILRSMVEICKTFGVGRETVQEWIQEGAPIAVEKGQNKPRYSTECLSLQSWRVNRRISQFSKNTFICNNRQQK